MKLSVNVHSRVVKLFSRPESRRFRSSHATTPGIISSLSPPQIQVPTTQVRLKSDVVVELPHSSQPLGYPLPNDEHACSVSLPTWSSVVGYEEGDPNITRQLKCGYPRFVYHPYVLQLMDCVLQKYSSYEKDDNKNQSYVEDCLVVPTKAAALRCQTFLQLALQELKRNQVLDNALITSEFSNQIEIDKSSTANNTSRVRIIEWNTLNEVETGNLTDMNTIENNESIICAVLFPATTVAGMQAKAYWQHTGEIVSSRRAEKVLQNLNVPLRKYVTDDCSVLHSAFCNAATNADLLINEIERNSDSRATKSASTPSKDLASVSSPHELLRSNIAQWAEINDPDYVFLMPSGMASLYGALRSSRRYQLQSDKKTAATTLGGISIVYGFPYLDTLKLCSRPEFSPAGVEFFGTGCSNDLHNLKLLLEKSSTADGGISYCGLFTEVPSNPLLQCPDLIVLRELADEYNFCLIIDDTISNFLNIDVISTGIADAVCTSLTKIVSGRGDAIAGSIVCNPNTPRGRWMQQDLYTTQRHQSKYGGLHTSDARAIVYNSADFVERNEIINLNSVKLAEWLHSNDCPDVDKVYYPKLNETSVDHYHRVQRSGGGGYGGLLSITLHSHMCQRHFYDALDVAKGPSLGTNFTLVCPYTLLAHYHELDFAMGYNVPPNLLRIAVGLEPFESLQDKFYKAFQTSRLYPKPKKNYQ